MTRGFKYLYSRMLIETEVELTELEKKLLEADKHEAAHPAPNFVLRYMGEERDGNKKHKELRKTIREKLKEHSKPPSSCVEKLSGVYGPHYEAMLKWKSFCRRDSNRLQGPSIVRQTPQAQP